MDCKEAQLSLIRYEKLE